jgi:hypothetical protein
MDEPNLVINQASIDPGARGGALRLVAQRGHWSRRSSASLHPTAEQEELLRRVGDQCARLVNMENYRRRQLFFAGRGIDEGVKTAREIAQRFPEYQEVKEVLGARNFDEALRKISEAWRSFAELLRERKRGELPPWMNPRPPGYRKRGGERLPIVIVRADNYRIDAVPHRVPLGHISGEAWEGQHQCMVSAKAYSAVSHDAGERWHRRVRSERGQHLEEVRVPRRGGLEGA